MSDPLAAACESFDLHDAMVVTDLFEDAAELYREDSHRKGSLIDLPSDSVGSLVISGDLHDHRLNLRRLAKLAKLDDEAAASCLVIQELIHGPSRINGCDLSVRTLAYAAALKVEYPQMVYQLLSNHELSQVTGQDIMKGGTSTSGCFAEGLAYLFGDDADTVADAIKIYVLSLPIALRAPNLMCAHSLPSPRRVQAFDPSSIEQPIDELSAMRGSWAYDMVWGRHHDDATCDHLAKAWRVEGFVLGHQPADFGVDRLANRALVVNSDHDHGKAVRYTIGETVDLDAMENEAVQLIGVSVDD